LRKKEGDVKSEERWWQWKRGGKPHLLVTATENSVAEEGRGGRSDDDDIKHG
jgi:hypothetical protein